MNLLSSSGILSYSFENGQYRLVVEVDKDLARYYRSLIPKYIDSNGTRWAPHITVVRPYKETVPNKQFWGKYQDEVVEFQYENCVRFDKIYFWLNVFCKRLETIRIELGMSVTSPFTRPPDGYAKAFHCTIANSKIL